MINKVQLIQAKVQGFRGFEKVYAFQFEPGKNLFIGDNGEGKTSIGEVISWILTGKNVEGKQKELNIINQKCEKAFGQLVFRDESGNIHEVLRTMGSSTSIKYNLQAISQKKLEEIIPSDLFLSIFNPIYFLSLDKEASRKTILSLIPTITKENVLDEMSQYEKDVLSKEDFTLLNTNEYLKNKRQELKENEDNQKYLEGYLGKLKEAIEIPPEKTFDTKQIEAIQAKIDEINNRKAPQKSMEDVLKKKNEISSEFSKIQHSVFPKQQVKNDLLQEKAVLQQKKVTETQRERPPVSIGELESQVATLRANYRHAKDATKEVDTKFAELEAKHIHVKEGDQCPSCKQVISKDAVSILQQELQKEISQDKKKLTEEKTKKQVTLEELALEGKKLNEKIALLKKQDEDNQKEFEKKKAEIIAQLDKRIGEIDQEIATLDAELKTFEDNKTAKLKVLQDQINSLGLHQLEKENAELLKEFQLKTQAEKHPLQEELSKLQKEKDEVLKHEATRKNLIQQKEKQKLDMEKSLLQKEKYEKLQGEIEVRIDLMKSFNSKKIEIVNKAVSKHFQNVEINLQKAVPSTGEIKDCFDIMFEGKELKTCSTAETVKAGLEISYMISALSGKEYPVFIDNGESITRYESKAPQVIEVKVVADKPLTQVVNGKENPIVASEPKKKSSTKKSATA